MLYGYAGKILHVDLTRGKLSTEQPTEEFYKTYIGGSAMGTYYLFKNTPAGADPLGAGKYPGFHALPHHRGFHQRAKPDERDRQKPTDGIDW